jgi:transcriptional regulator with XRE-family HTH domain
MLGRMVATRPDDPAWSAVGSWLRQLREGRGWTLEEVAARKGPSGRPMIGSTRLAQVERAYHPVKNDRQTGLPQPGTLRGIEMALWIPLGRIDVLLEMARRDLGLPDPHTEPIVQPQLAGTRPRARAAGRRDIGPGEHPGEDDDAEPELTRSA